MLIEHHEIMKLIQKKIPHQEIFLKLKDFRLLETLDQKAQLNAVIEVLEVKSQKASQILEKSMFEINQSGVGPIDAFYQGLFKKIGLFFPSTKGLHLSYFQAKGKLEQARSEGKSDAIAEIIVGLENSLQKEFRFSQEQCASITEGSFQVLLKAASYFINVELAFTEIYKRYHYSKARENSEIQNETTIELALLVENGNFSETIEKIKKNLISS